MQLSRKHLYLILRHAKGLNITETAILKDLISFHRPRTPWALRSFPELSQSIGGSERNIHYTIKKLLDKDLIEYRKYSRKGRCLRNVYIIHTDKLYDLCDDIGKQIVSRLMYA